MQQCEALPMKLSPVELEKVRQHLFSQLLEGNSSLLNNKRFELDQDENGLLIIKKFSYMQIDESELTKQLDNLKEVANYHGKGYTVDKKDISIEHFMSITFSEEVSKQIIDNTLVDPNIRNQTTHDKIENPPVDIFGFLQINFQTSVNNGGV